MNFKSIPRKVKENLTNKKKWISFLAALVFVLIIVWVFFTQTGELARRSFMKSFGYEDDNRPKLVQVFNGGAKILELRGNYSVENYQGRLVLINKDTRDYIDIYGESSVVMYMAEGEQEVYDTPEQQ